MIKLIPAKLTGSPDASGWAQVHEFRPTDPGKYEIRGHFVAVIATSVPRELGVNAVLEGREILTRLHEEYFGNEILSAFEALKQAITKVSNEFSNEGDQIQIGAMVLMGETLSIGVSGGARAVLLRRGTLAVLADSSRGPVFVSGYVKPLDMLLVATKKAFGSVPQGVLKAALESGDPQTCLSEISPILHSTAGNGDFGVFAVKFQDTEQSLIVNPPANMEARNLGSEVSGSPDGFKKTLAGFLDGLIRIIPERRFYIRPDVRELGEERRKSVAIIAGIILLILLVVSVGFGLRQSAIKAVRSKYIDRLTKAQHELTEAKSLSSIDHDRARELLFDSKEIAGALATEGVKDKELDRLNSDIAQSMGDIAGIYNVNPEMYLDLSLLTSGFKGESISLSDTNMLVLDKQGQKVVSIDTSTKKTEIVAGPDLLKNATEIAAYTDKSYVADERGILDVGGDNPRVVIGKDWDGGIKAAAFTGNIYLLDESKSIIYRYQGAEGVFGTKENWFGAGVTPDLAQARAVAIDGSIWVLGSSGRILKFTLGKPDPFNISGVDGTLSGIISFYTNEDNDNLYLLDKTNQRVIVIDKKGVYKAQYTTDLAKDATGIVASEKDGKIIILVGPKLYSIELKNQ